MKAWTIVGYAFNADIYCNGICILRALGEIGPVVYDRVATGSRSGACMT